MKGRAGRVLLAGGMMLFAVARAASEHPAPTQLSFHVAGVVLREGTNVPVPRCHLVIRLERQRRNGRVGALGTRLRAMEGGGEPFSERTAETDPQGHFAFDLPTEGRWQLSASATGFRTQFYNEHEGYSSAVVVRTGGALPTLVFSLEPDSTISGFVRDEAGEAVRNAVVLLQQGNATPGAGARRLRATTDDRGRYEIDEVEPGSYKVSAQGTPWYVAVPGREGGQSVAGDPTFDVVYPVTWYPGVLDSDTAGQVKLHSGQATQVDFNLLPVAAAHLRVAGPSSTSSGPVAVPMIERVDAGMPTGMVSAVTTDAGQLEFSGLSPGLYRVSTSLPDGRSTTAFLHVTAGAGISLSGMDATGTADVTCRFAGDDLVRAQVVLTDVVTGATFRSSSRDAFGLRRRALSAAASQGGAENDWHIAAPAGRYQVTLTGEPDLYVTSLSLGEKSVAGRLMVLPGGSTTLTLHVARGRASLTGRALVNGKPVPGAMILLVPASFGQPGSNDLLRRDQSNTDGSYELEGIVPGDYILLAIDHGWTVNWQDPATLDRYLLHGTPLSLPPRSKPEEDVPVQSP